MKKKVLSLLLALALLCALLPQISLPSAASASGSCGKYGSNVRWSFNSATGVLTISGSGDMMDYRFNGPTQPWSSLAYDLAEVRIEAGVTSIGDCAFEGFQFPCITLPEGLKTIGKRAFCCNEKLESITIPDSVTAVGSEAFLHSGLQEAIIGRGLQRIESFAFCECFLTTLKIGSGVKVIESNAFMYSSMPELLILPSSVTTLEGRAFFSCGVKRIVIPASVTEIGAQAIGYDYIQGAPSVTKEEDIVIYGYSGTAAETYAKENGFEFKRLPTQFLDVLPGSYCASPVNWAVKNKITTGMTKDLFGPDETCTRGQVVTFLWRAKGCPEPSISSTPFTDLKENSFYYKAVLWAVGSKIASGLTKTTFGPDEPCTRGQVVTFLWRLAGKPAVASTATPYLEAVQKVQAEMPYLAQYTPHGEGFFYDLDGDGTQELILGYARVSDKSSPYKIESFCCSVYTIRGGKLVALMEHREITYLAGGNEVSISVRRVDGQIMLDLMAYEPGGLEQDYMHTFYALENGSLVLKHRVRGFCQETGEGKYDHWTTHDPAACFSEIDGVRGSYNAFSAWMKRTETLLQMNGQYGGWNRTNNDDGMSLETLATVCKTGLSGFGDVVPLAYYYSPILWAIDRGITVGVTPTTFAPDATCTRGQIVTFLYRDLGKTAK